MKPINKMNSPLFAKGVAKWEAFKTSYDGPYDLSPAVYAGMNQKIKFVCPKHGLMSTDAKNLMNGKRCYRCAVEGRKKPRLTKNNFIERAKQKHGDTYDYSKVAYKKQTSPVTIICQKHGAFEQRAGDHIYNGAGCPKCNCARSRGEDDVAKYLETFAIVDRSNRKILDGRELDIYLPEHKLAIEFHGMYWHSHGDPSDEKANKYNSYKKFQDCAKRGIRLITLYETEWQGNPRQVKRLLRASIGKLRGKVMARKCELRKVPLREAKSFYELYHPQGGKGHGEHYGLYWKGKLVACMRFTLGVNDRGRAAKNRTWTLSRYATRVTVSGGASKLFKAFLRNRSPEKVKSFSDNRLFGGGMYEKLGFVLEQEVDPDYQVWSNKLSLLPKSHYQRRNLPNRLKDHGIDEEYEPDSDPRSEAEMTYLMGARRIYDCGKKRWVYTP